MTTITLPLVTVITSIVSGLIGMGGSVLLVAFLTIFVDLKAVVPIHGIVQLTSNIARAAFLQKYIHANFFKAFALGTPIGHLQHFWPLVL